jgi:hypothetical protein
MVIAAVASPSFADSPNRPSTPTPAPTGRSPSRLAALVAADDARASLALGPSGELYEPDGKGAWVRRHAGGVASEITTAARAGQDLVVGTHVGAYRLSAAGGPKNPNATAANAWSVIYLGQHAKPVTAFGGRAFAAVGRQLFALDRGAPVHLTDAAQAIVAIGAGPSSVVVLTDHGLFRLAGKTLAPIAGAPQVIAKLVSDRWALVEHGAFDLRTGAMLAWPAGFAATAAASAADDSLVACGAAGDGFDVVSARNGKLDREHVSIAAIAAGGSPSSPSPAPPSPAPSSPTTVSTAPVLPVAIVADRAGRLVVAMTDGRIAIRDRNTWTMTVARDELPAPHPGSPPATSH